MAESEENQGTSPDITDDIAIVESVKDKSKESAIWLFFEKTDEEKSGSQGQCVANCKECGKSMKVVKGNTSNLMSHLKTKHSKIYEEVRRKTDEKRKSKLQTDRSCQSRVLKRHTQQSLPGIAPKKAKLNSSSTLHKKITRGIAGMMIHDFQPYSFV